jgi:hypothetical protein
MRNIFWLSLIVGLAGCARVMPPTGGEQDQEAPRVVETQPEQGQMAAAFAGSSQPVRIIFHETISERSPREMVQVSPETGEVDVDRDGNELKVTLAGGWREGRVYRVTVLPGIVDRRGNARTTPYELVFSTGAPILPNALGGIAVDRITGRPAVNARVEARLRADTASVYTTVTDSAGFFVLRSMPAGDYTALVYTDQNRNRTADLPEAQAMNNVTIGATDTIALEVALLARDTTPPRLLRAEIRDSLQVRFFFDDYREADAPLLGISVAAWQLPDSLPVGTAQLTTPRGFQTLRRDTTRVTSPRLPQTGDTAVALPLNELVWIPQTPLRPNTRYRFTVSGYTNLQGLAPGGGSVTVTSPPPPQPATPAPRDSTARRDTTAVR